MRWWAGLTNSGPGRGVRKTVRYILAGFLICLLILAIADQTQAEPLPLPLDRLRPDHPRLFINRDLLPAIKAQAHGPAQQYYQDLIRWAEESLAEAKGVGDYGDLAAAMALIHLISGRPGALSAAKNLLEQSIRFYRQCDRANKSVSWTSTSRINALCAFDWLYKDLNPQQRKKLGVDLLEHTEAVQPGPGRKRIPGQNWSRPGDGFYGTPSLLWYAGLVLSGEGIDDNRAKSFLKKGYDLYQKEFTIRSQLAGDDGGLICSSLNYVMNAYPWAEFNFFHSMKSAFNIDLAPKYPYLPLLVNYIHWNRLPNNHCFGSGDDYHDTNKLPQWQTYTHLAQIRHLYGQTHPQYAALAAWIMHQLDKRKYALTWPVAPLLLSNLAQAPPPKSPAQLGLPLARHFEGIGQIFMRSGMGDGDTYAVFIAGAKSSEHKHFDENNFCIYHKGFLALDTGSRPEPGSHLYNYYSRTIAHNCILIYMPGEKMPGYWGDKIVYAPGEPPLPTPNDGGMREPTGSKVVAFEICPKFTYIAADATACYHPDKSKLVLRQFLFIPPRHFVIFDRVDSKAADQKKTWLLHTARKPIVDGKIFQAEQGMGRLFGQTLLPKRASIQLSGGQGKQFWNGGRNWPFPPNYEISPYNELLGQWRVEVSPAELREKEMFLHLIEVGDMGETRKIVPSELILDSEHAGVKFERDGETVWVTFGRSGNPKGAIRFQRDGKTRTVPLTQEVQKQAVLSETVFSK